jgi:endonuclease G
MKIQILLILTLLVGCAAQRTREYDIPRSETGMDGVPERITIDHGPFKILYNTKRRLPELVSYELTAEHLKAKVGKRSNKFIVDPLLMEQNIPFVAPSEYTHSGYDRGHMAPSADFLWNQNANDSTFVMSNMAPQTPNLNRDSWKKLEDKVRRWACGEGKVMVITGPVLIAHLPKLKSGLEIPQKFFKIIIDETPPMKVISFIYDQDDHGDMLAKNQTPLKDIEVATGIAFNADFPELKNEKIRLPAAENEWKEADCEN